MAGVRKKKLVSGKYQGWFVDQTGERRFFAGTHNSRETLRIAEKLEDDHRQIRLGYREAPKVDSKHSFTEIAEQYISWGRTQGGIGGRPWSPVHLQQRTRHMKFWQQRLNLDRISDIRLTEVEKVVRDLFDLNKTGKTVQTHLESLKAVCLWAKGHGYLASNPLEGLTSVDITPRHARRGLTDAEIQKLLEAAPEERRLIYETALCTGYRKGELGALTVASLDVGTCTLSLAAKYCKGRRDARQPISNDLANRLKASAAGKAANAKLFEIDFHIDRLFARDVIAAGIEVGDKRSLVFHSLRHTYCTLVIEAGANVKEAQTMLRHSDPKLTMNIYAKARHDRMQATAEAIGKVIFKDEKCVQGVFAEPSTKDRDNCNTIGDKCLDIKDERAGEGVRTLDFDLGKVALYH